MLPLPPGRGVELHRDMQRFVEELGPAITAAFEGDEYRSRAEAIQNECKEKEDQALRELGHASGEEGLALLRTPHGFVFAPMKGEATISPEEFGQLPEVEQERIGRLVAAYSERLPRLVHQFPRWRRDMQARQKQLGRETMALAAGHLVEVVDLIIA